MAQKNTGGIILKSKKIKFSKHFMQKITAIFLSAVMISAVCIQAIPVAFASETLKPGITYTSGDYTFEKISHPDSPVETPDGIVDYIGNGSVAPYVSGESEGNGDRGQSYSYASAVYGDWIYINTMYGGLGVSSILGIGMSGMSPEVSKAMMDAMYNGNLYTGEPDGKYAGGILIKFNVKTGETKILMSRDKNGLIPTFRNAIEMNGKLYFVGMVIDIKKLTPAEISKAIAMQNGFPCIYEIDPENDDKMTCIYDCVDVDGYRKLVDDKVFTSTRAIGTYQDNLIAGCLDTDGVFLCASKNPSEGQSSFKVIATMEDLFNYPAYHRSDVNGGGGIYQVIEYNNKLYVVLCTGTADTKNPETGTLRTYAIVRGECNGAVDDKNSWTWSVLAGDKNDCAKYPFGLDEERVSCGACTLEIYDGYLYIGEYNDVSSALQGFVLRKDFTTQATNLEQSINLYRMNTDEEIEMVVGDPTSTFPEGGISGMGSGYETHMSQYTWQMTVYDGKLYVSTMDTTTLLEPIAQLTNGDIINMTEEEWNRQVEYIRVLLELLKSSDNNTESTDKLIKSAVEDASDRATETMDKKAEIELTTDQTAELKQAVNNGELDETISDNTLDKLTEINNMLTEISSLIDTTETDEFLDLYSKILDALKKLQDYLPDSVKPIYDMLMSYATEENLKAITKSLKYMATSKAGFDLYEITQNDDDSVDIATVTNNGFGDRYNHGLRIFANTPDYWVIGTANPFYGTQLWRKEHKSATEYEIGDVNRDGVLSIDDATEIQKLIASLTEFDDEQMLLADINGDGSVSIADATEIQKILAE